MNQLGVPQNKANNNAYALYYCIFLVMIQTMKTHCDMIVGNEKMVGVLASITLDLCIDIYCNILYPIDHVIFCYFILLYC